uniref:Uncharacterized protein n=1 Tax=Fagus sylvatica TaxID=28930 RepID=A0A2N9HQ95_FAGSY
MPVGVGCWTGSVAVGRRLLAEVGGFGLLGLAKVGRWLLAKVRTQEELAERERQGIKTEEREKNIQRLVNFVLSYESEVVQEITERILIELFRELPMAPEHLVGIDSRVEEIMKLLFGELDDVRSIGIWGMAGIGSRIIITSRDKQLLAKHCLILYPAMGLDNDEALELFSWKAFEKPYPEEDYLELSKAFVEYAKGLPLALAVLGSSLFGEDKDRLADILEVDYDYKNGIDTLQKKSLIIILGRKVLMHDLLQEMGWEIVRCEPQLGRRSRLLQEMGWEIVREPQLGRRKLLICDDVLHVLKTETGTESIEGIKLSLPPHVKEELKPKTFSMMTRLRLLIIHNVHLPGGLSYLSNELRLLQWNEYPLKSMPESFQPKKLVELIMHHSHIEQLPKGFSNLQELKLIDLSYSQYLKETPNFIGFSKLERLIFQGCISLCELHPSVGALKRLTLLNLKECKRLNCLPPEINLESLEIFILSGCSKLKKFSEIGTNMTRLSELYLDGTAVEEMPLSIKHLTSLTLLSLQDCKNLSSFPGVNLPSLKILNLSGCKVQTPKSWLLQGLSLIRAPYDFLKDYFFPIQEAVNLLLPRFRFIVSLNLTDHNLWDGALPDDLSCLSSLQDLDLSRNNFTHLPDSISQLSKLKRLTLNDCSRLQSLPVLPLRFTIVDSDCSDDAHCLLPISPYEHFEPFFERFMESPGSSVTIPLPSDLRDNSSWEGIALFVVVVIHKNLNNISSGQDYEVLIDFICRSGMVEAGKLRDHLEECGCIGASIMSNHPYLGIKMCAARILYRQNLLEFFQVGEIDKRSQCQGDLARNHKYDYVFPHITVPNWFSYRSFCPYIRVKRPADLQSDVRWMGIAFIECGIRLVYEEDVEEFVQTLVQCMLRSSVAYHEFFYQNLSHQVEEMVAGFDNRKDVGCSSSLQRIPQPMPKLLPSIENIAKGCTYPGTFSNMAGTSRNFSPSFTGLLIPAGKGQHASIMSSESLIKAYLQKNFEEGEIFNCCFAEREIPRWFGSQSNMDSLIAHLSADNCTNDPDWIGCALCGLFVFHRHPTVVRMNLGSRVKFFQFRCLLRTNSCHELCYGILTEENELVTLNQRAFIWVLFIPRMKLAHLWSQSTRDVAFWFESYTPDLSVEKIVIKLVNRKNMEEFTRMMVQCSAPFDSFLDSCDQELFYQIWDDFFLRYSMELRALMRTYTLKGYSFLRRRLVELVTILMKRTHSLTIISGTFIRLLRIIQVFQQEELHCGSIIIVVWHSVTIDIPPNLYDDSPLMKKMNGYLVRDGLIWISYIPGEAFKDMLHQGGCIEASFVSNWPGVTVLKCGLRLLYQHDQDFDGCSKYSSCSPPVEILHWFKHNSNEPSVTIDISTNLYNDGEWKGLALCAYFSIDDHQPFENPSSAISHHLVCLLETNVVGQKLVLHVHRTAKEEFTWLDTDGGFLWLSYIPRQSFPDQFSQYSYIEASIISDWPGVIVQKCGFSFYNVLDNWFWQARDRCDRQYVNRNFKDRLTTKYIEETYRAKNHLYEDDPHSNDQCCQSDPQSFNRGFVYNSCFPPIEIPHWFKVRSDKPKVRFRLWYNGNTWMGLALCALFEVDKDVTDVDYIVNSKNSYSLICHLENKIGSVKPRHIYWPTQQHLMLSHLGGILEWCSHRSDVPRVTIPLPPNLYNDSTWMGLVLCTSFAVDVNKITYILNLEFPFVLRCDLKTHVGSVETFRAYRLTKENIRKLQPGGFIWLFYIGRGSFQTSLDQCSCIKASFSTNYTGLKVQKCGLRLLYRNDVEEFKQTIGNWMKQMHDDEETSSRTSSSSEDSHLEILRGPIDSMLKDKGKRVLRIISFLIGLLPSLLWGLFAPSSTNW